MSLVPLLHCLVRIAFFGESGIELLILNEELQSTGGRIRDRWIIDRFGSEVRRVFLSILAGIGL